jgi:hypothetical protein
MANDYQISNEDIDATLRHLAFDHPKHATREYAKAKRVCIAWYIVTSKDF